MYKSGAFVITLILCFSCATNKTNEDYAIRMLLNPKFPVTLGLRNGGPEQVRLLDNDGNTYITYWEVPDEQYAQFAETVANCRESLSDQHLFLSAYTIHEYDIGDIRPTLYKPFVSCILGQGYKSLPNEAYNPEYFELTFSRSQSTGDKFMPVGARFRIEKPNAAYKQVFEKVLSCDKKIISAGLGVNETYGYAYQSVSIEAYVEEFTLCMETSGYKVRPIPY
jgi:hypothetical protein